jgi:NADH-quinone oxidoreductase subunit G
LADGDNNLVTLYIDGEAVSVPKGTMIIEAARKLGVDIPIFCYHKHMEPVGMCRMCLVEIEGWPKPATACNTPVAADMKVITDSDGVRKMRRGVVEFLLINHPLDCPICDRGGECPLQDNTVDWGPGTSRFDFEKRHFRKHAALGPFIVLDMERCIHCGRCVRFMSEVADEHKIEFTKRGSRMEIRTFEDEPLIAKFSGNAVEICPTGAFTSAVYRFRARPWDIEHFPTVCAFCSVGCNMAATVREQRIVRNLVAENVKVSETWLCDKGRFVHHLVDSDARLRAPLVREGDRLVETAWESALAKAAAALKDIVHEHGPGAVGGIGGSRTAIEDAFLFGKFLRDVIGTRHIDHRLSAQTREWRNPVMERLGAWAMTCRIEDIDRAGAIMVVGSDPMEEHPVIGLRIRKAATKLGAHLSVAAPMRTHMAGSARLDIRIKPDTERAFLIGVARAVLDAGLFDPGAVGGIAGWDLYKQSLGATSVETAADACGATADQIRAAADAFARAEYKIIVFEKPVLDAPSPDTMQAIVNLTLLCGNTGVMGLVEHNNSMGAVLCGLVPGGETMTTREMLEAAGEGRLKGLVLLGANPVAHFPDRGLAEKALKNLECFIALELFETESTRHAHFLFPARAFAERDGTFVNCEGRMHAFRAVVPPQGASRPDWRILTGLANAIGAKWEYPSIDHVRKEMRSALPYYAPESVGLTLERRGGYGVYQSSAGNTDPPGPAGGKPCFVPVEPAVPRAPTEEWPFVLLARKMLFDNGTLTKRTPPAIEIAGPAWCRMSRSDARRVGVSDGDAVRVTSPVGSVTAVARVGDAVVEGVVFMPLGFDGAAVNALQSVDDATTCVRVEKAQP